MQTNIYHVNGITELNDEDYDAFCEMDFISVADDHKKEKTKRQMRRYKKKFSKLPPKSFKFKDVIGYNQHTVCQYVNTEDNHMVLTKPRYGYTMYIPQDWKKCAKKTTHKKYRKIKIDDYEGNFNRGIRNYTKGTNTMNTIWYEMT